MTYRIDRSEPRVARRRFPPARAGGHYHPPRPATAPRPHRRGRAPGVAHWLFDQGGMAAVLLAGMTALGLLAAIFRLGLSC
jgi:hypothetical protein